jgi:hypothetical protein
LEPLLRAGQPTPKELSLYGRIGAHKSWADTNDRSARTAPARAAFLARFDGHADPEAARKAYFLELARRSAQARKRAA